MIDAEIKLDVLGKVAALIDYYSQVLSAWHRYKSYNTIKTLSDSLRVLTWDLSVGDNCRLNPRDMLYQFLRDSGNLHLVEPFLREKPKPRKK